MKKILLIILITINLILLENTCLATTGTDLINQYLNTHGSTRVNFAEAGFKYYYEGYNSTTTWRLWLFSVQEPTIKDGKLYQLNGPFYVLNYTPNRGFYDNINYLNNSTNRNLSTINTSGIDGGSGGISAFNSTYYPNVVNSNISFYDRQLQYYEDLLNPTWNGVFEDGSQKGVINFNENGYYIYTNPLYPGVDYSKFRLILNLVEFSANGVSQMTKESMSPSYADNIVKLQDILTQSLENEQIISLESIKKYLKTSKIYRLEYSIIAYNQENSITTSAFCTSEFFSLTSWTSDKIIIRNISNFFNNSTGGIISPSGESNSGDYIINNTINNIGADINQNFDNLNQNLNDTILGEINESGERKGGLLGGIINGIQNIIDKIFEWLFVVDEEFIHNTINTFQNMMSGDLGLISLNNQLLQKTADLFLEEPQEDFIISWEPIIYQNIKIIPEGQINFNEFVRKKPIFEEIYNIYIIIISSVWIYAFADWMRELYLNLFGFTWIGNLIPEPETSTEFVQIDEDVDLDTGEIMREKITKIKRVGNKTTRRSFEEYSRRRNRH